MANTAESNYRAFLLRLWRADANAPWRASLVSPHGGEPLAFATLEGLMDYLNRPELPGDEPVAGSPSPDLEEK